MTYRAKDPNYAELRGFIPRWLLDLFRSYRSLRKLDNNQAVEEIVATYLYDFSNYKNAPMKLNELGENLNIKIAQRLLEGESESQNHQNQTSSEDTPDLGEDYKAKQISCFFKKLFRFEEVDDTEIIQIAGFMGVDPQLIDEVIDCVEEKRSAATSK